MHQPISAVPSRLLLLLLLLLCSPLRILVVAAPLEAAQHTPRDSSAPSWRTLSDAIINKLRPPSVSQKSLGTGSHAIPIGDAPGWNLVAHFQDDMVLRFTINTPEEALAFQKAADDLFLEVWEYTSDWVDVRIPRYKLRPLLNVLPPSLRKAHVPIIPRIDQAQLTLPSPTPSSGTHAHDTDRSYSLHLTPSSHPPKGHPFFQDYQPLSVISPWMSLVASMYTTHVRRITIGMSYEGREISALRVGVHPTNNKRHLGARKTILIVGGSHAREWISTSTVNYVAWALTSAYGKHREITKLLEQFDFVFVPTLNPDGYLYSWEKDRLWRKNRQPAGSDFCLGIDIDHSFSFQWDETKNHPCSEPFQGNRPFEAVESQRLADWAKNETEHNVEFVGFIDLHSYSQQILYPYSYTCDQDPPTLENLEEVALGLAKAIRTGRKGHSYKVTSACEGNVAVTKKNRLVFPRIEPSGGSALDWFYHEMKVKYSFQIKLRDTGSYGFLLPKENIIPTGNEILDAVLYLGRFMLGEVGIVAGAPTAQEDEQPTRAPAFGNGFEDGNQEQVEL